MINKEIKKIIKNMSKENQKNLMFLFISIILFIIAFIIQKDISLPIFGLGIIIIGVLLLRTVNK